MSIYLNYWSPSSTFASSTSVLFLCGTFTLPGNVPLVPTSTITTAVRFEKQLVDAWLCHTNGLLPRTLAPRSTMHWSVLLPVCFGDLPCFPMGVPMLRPILYSDDNVRWLAACVMSCCDSPFQRIDSSMWLSIFCHLVFCSCGWWQLVCRFTVLSHLVSLELVVLCHLAGCLFTGPSVEALRAQVSYALPSFESLGLPINVWESVLEFMQRVTSMFLGVIF